MKKLFLILAIASFCCADNVFLVETATGKVTDIMHNTAKNFATNQARVYSDKVGWEVRTGDVTLGVDYYKWDGAKVVEDTAKQTAIDFERTIQERIATKQRIMAIDELLKTSIGSSTTELQKQKAELEAKIP